MDANQTVVRVARPEDAGPIAEVHIQARNAYYEGAVPPAELERRAAELREIYPRLTDRTLLCAERAGEIVGMALLGPPHDDDLDPAEVGQLHQIHVRPELWRHGVGSLLHDACVEVWLRAGLSSAVLDVWDSNERARSFYARHGWAPDGQARPGPDGSSYLRLRRAVSPAASPR